MTRPKEFDRDEALQRAMEVFWSRGFASASVENLVAHMGINRQSLYDTFGDKHALYLQSLDRYGELHGRELFALLDRPGSVRRALRQFFQGIIERSLDDRERRGCFMVNAISELAPHCPETAAKTCSYSSAAEETFYRVLLRGKAAGELGAGHNLRALARFFNGSMLGLIVMAKATRDRKVLEDVVKVTLSVLD